MLGLKLNHVSKRGHWRWTNTFKSFCVVIRFRSNLFLGAHLTSTQKYISLLSNLFIVIPDVSDYHLQEKHTPHNQFWCCSALHYLNQCCISICWKSEALKAKLGQEYTKFGFEFRSSLFVRSPSKQQASTNDNDDTVHWHQVHLY